MDCYAKFKTILINGLLTYVDNSVPTIMEGVCNNLNIVLFVMYSHITFHSFSTRMYIVYQAEKCVSRRDMISMKRKQSHTYIMLSPAEKLLPWTSQRLSFIFQLRFLKPFQSYFARYLGRENEFFLITRKPPAECNVINFPNKNRTEKNGNAQP